MVEAVARFADLAGKAFPYLLFTILSWVLSQVLDGCAAYARAMYPWIELEAADHRLGAEERATNMQECTEVATATGSPELIVVSTRASVAGRGKWAE